MIQGLRAIIAHISVLTNSIAGKLSLHKESIVRLEMVILLTLLCIVYSAFSSETYTLSGLLTDQATGRPLEDATISVNSLSITATSNDSGFYSMNIPAGNHRIAYSKSGYTTVEKVVTIERDYIAHIEMKSTIMQLGKMTVTGWKRNENITSTELSVEKFEIEEIEVVPVIMGEKDIMKTIQLTPGITTITEGEVGFVVRGSGIDENLVLMDGMPMYYSSHMQGLYSVFNSDAVDNVTVYKGGTPAHFGGRSASVLVVSMKGDHIEDLRAKASIGLITSKFSLETPVIPEKLAIAGAGRFTKLSIGHISDRINTDEHAIEKGNKKGKKGGKGRKADHNYFFNSSENWLDLNSKIVYNANDKNTVRISGYLGRDSAITEAGLTEWGERAATLRLTHEYNDKSLSNTSATYSRYYTRGDGGLYTFYSGIKTGGGKQVFTFKPNDENSIILGLSSEYQKFNHGSLEDTEERFGKFMPPMQSLESALFAGNDQKLTEKLAVYYGLRWSLFHRLGPGKGIVYDDFTNEPVSSTYYSARSDIMQFYQNLEPRFSLTYVLNKDNSFKAFYNRSAQYLRLMTMGMQLKWYDIWLPCTRNVKPLVVDQFALGYFRNFFDDKLQFSAETYYKISNGSADFEDGLHNYLVDNLEAYVTTGKGRAYGLELMLKKPSGSLTGWLSYNLGRSERKITEVNKNRWYPTIFDKTHDITAVLNFNILDNLSVSSTFLYQTGNAVTLPEGYYYIEDIPFPYWEGRNKYRLPPYHRMDLGIRYAPEILISMLEKHGSTQKVIFELSYYNLYGRRNVNTMKPDIFGPDNGTSIYGSIPSFELGIEFKKDF